LRADGNSPVAWKVFPAILAAACPHLCPTFRRGAGLGVLPHTAKKIANLSAAVRQVAVVRQKWTASADEALFS